MVLTHRKCHHPESITSVTLKCDRHSCHSDVVLGVGVQPVQDHILLAVPVTDLVLAGSSSRLVVHLQREGEGGGGGRARGGGGREREGMGMGRGGEGRGRGGEGRGRRGEGEGMGRGGDGLRDGGWEAERVGWTGREGKEFTGG